MIQVCFITSLLFSIFITPHLIKISYHYKLLDEPSERKVHQNAIPRIGGVAIFSSFFLSLILIILFSNIENNMYHRIISFSVGAVIIFLIGLVDDIKRLSFKIKFFGQIAVSVLVYLLGLKIEIISNPFGYPIQLGILSLPITIFWFILIINSINLIDGLDGLAAGITLFASISMIFIHTMNNQIFHAAIFASLAGALIGFLRYNFNPASIFMGDSGSYFLGYCLAALSINSSKGQIATALLSPIIILGVPIFDTLWAPIRRFVSGKEMFQPDKGHIHHRFIQLGYTHRRAVILIYCITFFLGICAFILIHTQNQTSALIIFFLSVAGMVMAYHLNLSSLLTVRKVSSWARAITKNVDFSVKYRLFLNQQFELKRASDIENLWREIEKSASILEIDYARLTCCNNQCFIFEYNNIIRSNEKETLKMEIPLFAKKGKALHHLGSFVLVKTIKDDIYQNKIIQHIDILCCNISFAMLNMSIYGKECSNEN